MKFTLSWLKAPLDTDADAGAVADKLTSIGLEVEAVEDAGSQFRKNFWGPVQKASAVIQGIKIGLDVLRSRRDRSASAPETVEQEDELFI